MSEQLLRTKAVLVSLLAIATIIGSPLAVYAGYAPSGRPTFQCVTPTNCPGANYVTFNSFTNSPNYGDEHAFFEGKDNGDTRTNGYMNNVHVHNGQKLTLRVYIHNNANPNAIGEAAATAHNAKMIVLLPTSKKTTSTAGAQISADNANPGTVSDTVDFTGDSPFLTTFDNSQPVQVTYRPNGVGDNVTETLPSASLVSDHLLKANFGNWKGGFNFSALVTMTVVVKMDTPPPSPPMSTPTPTPTPPIPPPATTKPTPPTSTPSAPVPAPAVSAVAPPPASSKKLTNTGPGEVVGLFAVVTVAGALAHRKFLSRRLALDS